MWDDSDEEVVKKTNRSKPEPGFIMSCFPSLARLVGAGHVVKSSVQVATPSAPSTTTTTAYTDLVSHKKQLLYKQIIWEKHYTTKCEDIKKLYALYNQRQPGYQEFIPNLCMMATHLKKVSSYLSSIMTGMQLIDSVTLALESAAQSKMQLKMVEAAGQQMKAAVLALGDRDDVDKLMEKLNRKMGEVERIQETISTRSNASMEDYDEAELMKEVQAIVEDKPLALPRVRHTTPAQTTTTKPKKSKEQVNQEAEALLKAVEEEEDEAVML